MRGRLRLWLLLLLAELRRGESASRLTTVDCGAILVEIEERFRLLTVTDFVSHILLQLRARYWVIQNSGAI